MSAPQAPLERATSTAGEHPLSEVRAGAPRPGRPEDEDFEPNLIGFTCNWCSYRAADLAGTSRIKYPPNVRLIRLMCSGRLDPTFVLKALSAGADGVLITGCWPGDCHYLVQNHYAQRRFLLLRRTLAGLGIEPGRVKLVWASAAEGLRLAKEIGTFIDEVRALGPLRWPTAEPGATDRDGHEPDVDAAALDAVLEAAAAEVASSVPGDAPPSEAGGVASTEIAPAPAAEPAEVGA